MARVLFCDPEQEGYLTAKALLEQGGKPPLSVDWEATVIGASEAIRSGEHDVCLVKDTFASGRWTDLVEYVTEDGRHIPVILLLTAPAADLGVGALDKGAADVVLAGDLAGARLKRSVLYTLTRVRSSAGFGRTPAGMPPEDERVLRHRLDSALARASRGRSEVALMAVSVAELADAPTPQLRLAAEAVVGRIRKCLRDFDTVVHGGRDFLALIEDTGAAQVAAEAGQALLAALAKPFGLGNFVLNATAGIGVAAHPEDGNDPDELVAAARQVAQSALAAGGSQVLFHSPTMHEMAVRRLAIQQALEGAIERAEFELFYQPQVDLVSGQLVAVEALLRWSPPELGPVAPSEFLPVLESTSQIAAMEKWVLAEACSQAREWMDDRRPIRVNVNLSSRLFEERDMGNEIRRALRAFDVPPGLLGLEIPESLLTSVGDTVTHTLADLRSLGVSVTVDDFGTGPSSLRLIKSYPADIIKLDRELVRNVPADPENSAICQAVVALGLSLRLTVAAEGIESPAEAQFLRNLGCDRGQGYHYAKPMSPDDLVIWLKTRKRHR